MRSRAPGAGTTGASRARCGSAQPASRPRGRRLRSRPADDCDRSGSAGTATSSAQASTQSASSGPTSPIRAAFEAFEAGDAVAMARIAPTSLVYGAWDSRDTRVRIPRAIASTIRAVDVSVLTGSAQYSGAFGQATLGLDDAEWKKAAASGLAPAPCVDRPGGVLVHGAIVQSASVVLEGLRGYRTADASQVLPAYLLGLALGALVTTGRRYRLRSGCTLVPDGRAEWRAVTASGERLDIAIDAGTVVDELRDAAQAWSDAADVPLGAEPTLHDFDPDRARTMLSAKTSAQESP